MKTVLVTGGIGSGKSEVCKYLEKKGYPVYYSDSRAKELYEIVPGLKARLEKELEVPFENFKVIFEDIEKKKRLESIVYPILIEDFMQWRSTCISEIVFMESALAGALPEFQDLFDETILVVAPEFLRIRRAMKRDSVSREEIISRLKHQNPFTPHTRMISNITDLKTLQNKVDKLIETLI